MAYLYISVISTLYEAYQKNKYSLVGIEKFYAAWNLAYHLMGDVDIKELEKRSALIMAARHSTHPTTLVQVQRQIAQDYGVVHSCLRKFMHSIEISEDERSADLRDHPLAFGVEIKVS